MALIKWGQEEEEEKDLFGSTPVKSVQSVQTSWQPTQDNGATDTGLPQNQDNNYLMSDQKANFDNQLRQRKEIEAENARRAAAAAEAARVANEANRARQAEQKASLTPEQQFEAAKSDEGWKRFYDDEFKRENEQMNFWQRLMDNGQASRRAETNARNKYTSELLAQAYDDNGNILSQDAAAKASGLAAYNSAFAQDASRRSQAITNAIGANQTDGNFWDRVRGTANAIKNMSLYDGIMGADDSTRFGINDVGRFAGNLIQGIPTMPIIGAKELYEMGVGRGTDAETGLERDLNGAERIGRGVSGALNVALPFVTGGGAKFLDDAFGAVMKGTATQTQRQAVAQALRASASGAVTQGVLGGAQATGEWVGDGGSFLDENGNFDMDAFKEYAAEVGTATALSAAGGAIFAGGGSALRHMRGGKGMPDISAEDLRALERLESGEGNAARLDEVGGTPRVDDGRVRTETPTADANVSFENLAPTRSDGVPQTTQPTGLIDNAQMDTRLELPETVPDSPAPVEVAPRQMELDNLTPVKQAETPVEVAPTRSDGTVQAPADVVPAADPKMPRIRSEEMRDLQNARAGKTQAEEAAINAEIQRLDPDSPSIDSNNLPDDMTGVTPAPKEIDPKAQFAKTFMTDSGNPKQMRQELADTVGLSKDGDSPLSTILRDANVDTKTSARLTKLHDKMEEIAQRNRTIQKQFRKDFAAGKGVDESQSKIRNRDTRELAVVHKQFESELNRLRRQGVKNIGEKGTQMLENISSGRLANMLTGAGLIERNAVQEIGANTLAALKNPVKMARSTFKHGNVVKSAAKSSIDGWRDTPKTASETYKYLIGNTYKSAMTPVQALADMRKGGFRTEMTQWAYKELLDENIPMKEAEKLSRTAGNITESVVNMLAGVDNGMVSSRQAMKALDAWKQYIRSGELHDLSRLEKVIESQNTVADRLLKTFDFGGNSKAGRLLRTTVNSLFPFMRTAWNLTSTGVTRTMNPFSKSLLDDIRADQLGKGKNAMNILKNKLFDYGILGGAVALVQSGTVGYNNGDDVSKPRGVYISIGDNKYIPIRATPIEMPLATAVMVGEIVKDSQEGDLKGADYYQDIISGSLPYLDQVEQMTGTIDSLKNIGGKDGDDGYAAKSYGVNFAKSLTPFSNNGLQAYTERWKGNSLNAKKTYDADPMKWLYNSIMSSYSPEFRNSLEDSRDAAGRVRTVDNQGSFIRKDINDADTATHNETITNLVDYARKAGLGNGTQEMFNTYDTGKNNNFKSVQDSITFLDVEDGKPDNAKKLEQNEKIAKLSQQIRDGFFGDSGSELLTLNGKNLYSDVSVPGKYGGKNTRLPISMESIKNAIAQTDLPEDQRNALYEIGQQKNDLYARRKAGEITYDQEQAMRSEIATQEQSLLQNSESYKKMQSLMSELDESGFFDEGGLGSTKSGQTYLWNSLNALLGSKGATPAANYPENAKSGWGSGGGRRGSGLGATNKPGDRGSQGVKWTPVKGRQMATVQSKKYTPLKVKVKLGNAVKKDKTQNYSDRTI